MTYWWSTNLDTGSCSIQDFRISTDNLANFDSELSSQESEGGEDDFTSIDGATANYIEERLRIDLFCDNDNDKDSSQLK